MILDLHHFQCNHTPAEDAVELFPRIAATWQGTELPPKLHISSPKSEKDFRSHHDFVDPRDIFPFLCAIKDLNLHIDVMVEAKQKDKAMFKLVHDLTEMPSVKKLNPAAIEIK